VRCNKGWNIEFLKDERRVNVAITRARMGLMIIWSARVLASDMMWAELIRHFQAKELLVDGELEHLKPSAMIIERPVVRKCRKPA